MSSGAGSGTGAFTASLTGLAASTTYYVVAYATNSIGTGYGSQVSFTTSAAPTAVISAIPITTFTAFTTQQGTPSAAQTYTLSGTGLTAAVTVTAPTGYQVAQSTGATPGTYANTQTVAQADATAGSTISVRLTGTTAGIYGTSGTPVNVTNASTGATTRNVAVYGNTTNITVSPSPLSFSTPQGAPATAQSYALAGAGLTADITVTPPAGYEVSQTTNITGFGGDATAITVAQSGGSVSKTIYVRLTGTTAGSYSGDVTNASTGATTRNVAVTGTVTPPTPTLGAPTSLPSFNALAGSASAAQTYTLTGSNLTANVTVTAPANFEVSQDGATYAGTQTVTPSSGSVSATISVRLAATAAAGSYSGSVTNASTGATTQNVAVSGRVVAKPTGTPAVTAGTLTVNSAVLNLTAADGTNLLVVVRPNGSSATAPTDGTPYTASTAYGTGAALGAGRVVFAAANASSVTVTGLSGGTAYVADVYTYNVGTATGFESYGLNSGTASFTTPVPPPAAPGQLALEENFDNYGNSVQLANSETVASATGWYRNGSTTTSPIITPVSPANLTSNAYQYPQGALSASPAGASTNVSLATTGQDIYKLFSQPAGATTVYAAALMTVNSAQTGDYFLHFINAASPSTSSATSFRSRLWVRTVSGTTFNFGLQLNGEITSYGPAAYNIGSTYLVVMKYESSAATSNLDNATLFVLDPTAVPVAEPIPVAGPIIGGGSVQAALNAIGLRQGSSGSSPTVTIDAIRIASGWGAAVGRPVYSSGAGTLAAGSYYDVKVDNASTVTTAGAVSVESNLNLSSGILNTNAANILTLPAVATVTGGSNTSFISGPVRRTIGPVSNPVGVFTPFVFPVGKGGIYRPLTLNVNRQTSTNAYRSEQNEGNPGQSVNPPGFVGTLLTRVSRVRSFVLTPFNIAIVPVVTQPTDFSGTVTLSFGSDDGVTDESRPTLVVAKRSDSTQPWANIGNGGFSGNTITSGLISDFSDFALGSTDPDDTNNPLPVKLTAFTAARAERGSVVVAWATASEKNSTYFTVERSLDGKTFEPVAEVAAQGSSTQAHAYTSRDANAPACQLYYRLRQVDADGTARYSSVAPVAPVAAADVVVFPNPTTGRLSFPVAVATTYRVLSPVGQAVLAGTAEAGLATLSVERLPAGTYLLELQTDAGRVVRRFVKQ